MPDLDKQEYDDDKKPKRRRRMTKFRIDEISAVDRPAQAPARSVIMKRGDLADILTSSEGGHQHGISIYEGHDEKMHLVVSFARGEDSEPHDHLIVQSDNGEYIISENNGHTHDVNSESLRNLIFNQMINKSADFEKQALTRQVRERLAESGEAMKDGSFPIRNRTDLHNAIQAFGRASNKAAVARHIKRRARALNLTNMLPEEGVLANLLKSDGGENPMPKDNNTELTKKIDKLQADLKKAEKISELNDEQKAYYKNLSDTDGSSFLNKSAEDRQIEVDNAKADDPIVYKSIDGAEFRKSDDPRVVASIKKADAMQKRLDDEINKRENLEFQKRAEEEFGHLSGKVETRVAVLKAIEGIKDEEIRKSAFEMLKSNNDSMAHAFKSRGINTPIDSSVAKSAESKLETLAKKHASEKNISFAKAYSEVLNTTEGKTLYDQAVEH